MRICFVTTEVFGFGIIGGFGKIVADMANELSRKGVETCIVTWRNNSQKKYGNIGNVPVYGALRPNFELPLVFHLPSYVELAPLSRICHGDIYLNIELKSLALIAQSIMPHKKHVMWFQDPYDEEAYQTMASVDSRFRWTFAKKLHFYGTISWLRKSCQKADLLLTQARDFIPIIERLYKPKNSIHFMPNPVEIPIKSLKKASRPTVCFLGRWDPQKRIELFFNLSKKFPDVKFIAMGKSNFPKMNPEYINKYKELKNVEMPGFVSEEEKSRILEKSWILINTSIREGLPLNFLEACAHKTAILSYVNPDRLASKFGYCVANENFESGLKKLLWNDLWKEKAELGYKYVRNVHAIDKVANNLLAVIDTIL